MQQMQHEEIFMHIWFILSENGTFIEYREYATSFSSKYT